MEICVRNTTDKLREKKMWLSGYRYMMQQLRALLEERAQWMSVATHITPQYSLTPKGGGEDKVQRSVDKLADIDAQIFSQLEAIERRRAEIAAAISKLPDERYRAVLQLHYINGYSYELVAVKMNYDFRWVKKLNREALLMIEVPEDSRICGQ